MGGIMLNEDCNHYVYSRNKAGIKVGINELNEFIDQYENTQVKEFVINVNAMLAWFPSKSHENSIEKYRKMLEQNLDAGESGRVVETLYDIFEMQGLDMYKIWIERLRQKKISPWISIRMNDLHNNEDDNHFLHSSFFQKNKHMRRVTHRPHSSYYDNALDYSNVEVREHYLSLIKEVVERYDIDGLELDWMREAFCIKTGKELEGQKIINDFMQDVRKILDRAEKVRDHRIKMSVRVPQSPEIALRFGFDVINWAKSGLVNIVIPTARWASTDNDMPIDLWKRILDGTGVALAAGLEILIEAVSVQPKRVMFNTLETARGSAAAYLGMGADRVYLFNYMDVPTPDSFNSQFAGTAIDSLYYRELLTTIGELETLMGLPRRHVVTYHDITAPGVRLANPLPIHCILPEKNEKNNMQFNDVRIATGPIDKNSEITLVIGATSAQELCSNDLSVYINGTQGRFRGLMELPNPRPACNTYSYEVINNGCFPEASIIEIASTVSPFTVEWVELSATGVYKNT